MESGSLVVRKRRRSLLVGTGSCRRHAHRPPGGCRPGHPPWPGQRPGGRRVLLQHRLDFPQLNAIAADFHLVIHTTEKLEVAIWAGSVPDLRSYRGVLPARSKRGAGEKLHRGELGPVAIPLGQAGTPDVEFPGHANGHGLTVAVEHIDLRVGDGTTDGHAIQGRGVCGLASYQVTSAASSDAPYRLTRRLCGIRSRKR